MKQFGLIGYPLTHSFSKKYFTDKFSSEGLNDCSYALYELTAIDQFPELLKSNPKLCGLNVTIPYKELVMPYLDELDATAQLVGAVNVIKVKGNILIGYNSDFYGFATSLDAVRQGKIIKNAIVLGTGGASKAVVAALKDLRVQITMVSRSAKAGALSYDQLKESTLVEEADLIVNSTPLGMYPKIDSAPNLEFEKIQKEAIAFDLVYNPEKTKFLQLAEKSGAKIKNGLEMLELQAAKSWEIWNA